MGRKRITKTCKVENCNNRCHATGYCQRHYKQIRRVGKIIPNDELYKLKNPSKIRILNNICYIELYNRKGDVVDKALIDTDDYEKVKNYRLHIQQVDENYVRVRTNTRKILHHIIIGKAPKGMYVDHINRNTLDNRKCNLRFVTPSQSCMNRNKTYAKKTSIYKGVCWDKSRNKWKAEIKLNRKGKYIGRFDKEVDAAIAYNEKAVELFGEYAVLNVIQDF